MNGIGSLPLFHRVRGRRVVVVAEGIMGEAKARLVERAGGIPCSEAEAHDAHLAFVALEDPGEAEKVATRLKRRGLLVNVADRPELCDFTTPSILDREPVLVAVSTSGASAGLAKHLRLRLESILPESLGALAAGLRDARDAMRTALPDGDERRRAVDAALGQGGMLDPFDPGSAARIGQWLSDPSQPGETGTHHIVLRSDDPEDLTLREARLLGTCDILVHDPHIAPAILNRARADAQRVQTPAQVADGADLLVVRLEKPES